jgi:hypothetical protein
MNKSFIPPFKTSEEPKVEAMSLGAIRKKILYDLSKNSNGELHHDSDDEKFEPGDRLGFISKLKHSI